MSFSSLFGDTCVIQRRSVARGKIDTESWKARSPTKCRVLKRERSSVSGEKVQTATRFRTVFVLPRSAEIAVRDRIEHENRIYEVIEITQSRGRKRLHHLNAVCDAVV